MNHLEASHLPCCGPERLSSAPGRSRGPALGEADRPDSQEPTQQRELHSKAPSDLQGRLCKGTLGGWEVGSLPCSVPPALSWEPSAGLLTPTSLSFSTFCPALHVPTSLPCLRPGNFWSTVSSGHTWPVVRGSPCWSWPLVLSLPQDQCLRVCRAPEV